MVKKLMAGAAVLAMATAVLSAQGTPASPEGKAQVQVGYTPGPTAASTGKWVEITYSRPVLRGRADIFGGTPYGSNVVSKDETLWRAGANVSTRLRTEAPLVIGGKTVPAGEYSVFIDLKPGAWTFVLSKWAAAKTYPPPTKDQLWGSYGYTPDKDVVRAPMKLMKSTVSVEQLTWGFINVTVASGELALWWDKEFATVPFTVAK